MCVNMIQSFVYFWFYFFPGQMADGEDRMS